MLKAYKGLYENGNLILDETDQASMPSKAEVIITIVNDKSPEAEAEFREKQRQAAIRFLEAVDRIHAEGLTEEDHAAIDELQSGKYKPHFEERL